MKNIELDFLQRFHLLQILGQQEGNLAKTAAFFRMMEQMRFTDAENARIVTQDYGEFSTFTRPEGEPDFGRLQVKLEDADATALREMLNSWPKFKTIDRVWAVPVVDQLK